MGSSMDVGGVGWEGGGGTWGVTVAVAVAVVVVVVVVGMVRDGRSVRAAGGDRWKRGKGRRAGL